MRAKKYKVVVDGVEYEVEVLGDQVTLSPGGFTLRVEGVEERGSEVVVKAGGRAWRVKLEEGLEGALLLNVEGQYHVISSFSELLSIVSGGRDASIAENVIRAPLSGRVTKVYVSAGQEVGKGDRLVAIESMKMENVISSPRGAKVKEVRVKEGSVVSKGDVLIVLD